MAFHILVLSVSAGAGHVRAAEAICSAARASRPAVRATHLDLLTVVPRDFRKLYGTFAALAPLRSNISAEDVGKTALWLASDLSSAVTGEVVYVDGGFNVLGVPLVEE